MKRFVLPLVLLLFALPLHAEESEYEYCNPHPVFKPMTIEEQKAALEGKLGPQPKLTEEQLKELRDGEVLTHEVTDWGKDAAFEAEAIFQATIPEIDAYMRDYPARAGVWPHMTRCTAKWDGNMAFVEQTLEIAWSDIDYQLHMLHTLDRMIEWEYVCGDVKSARGFYKFFPLNDTETLVVYRQQSDPGLPVPGFVLDMLTEDAMPDLLNTIREEVKKRKTKAPAKQ